MSRTVPLLLLMFAGGCIARRPGSVGHETPHVPGIKIIEGSKAASLGLRGVPFELTFGDNQDGTKLVIEYLDGAKRSGARFVSDIEIVLVTRREGRAVSCSSKLLPFAKKESYQVKRVKPARTERRMVMKPVTRTVTEQRYECRMVSRPVTRYETRYESRYDYSTKSTRTVPVSRSVTRYEYRNECRHRSVTRTVTRYEHQYETRYIPPRVEYLRAHYTDFDLIVDRPVCTPTKRAAKRPPHRISGTVYRGKSS